MDRAKIIEEWQRWHAPFSPVSFAEHIAAIAIKEINGELDRLKSENHDLNVALGSTGYEDKDWSSEEDREASKSHMEIVFVFLM